MDLEWCVAVCVKNFIQLKIIILKNSLILLWNTKSGEVSWGWYGGSTMPSGMATSPIFLLSHLWPKVFPSCSQGGHFTLGIMCSFSQKKMIGWILIPVSTFGVFPYQSCGLWKIPLSKCEDVKIKTNNGASGIASWRPWFQSPTPLAKDRLCLNIL